MGSQTLEILRQGVWASLTGGWFYDPHQDVFCNTFHLYIWLFLLCLPFTIYVYFPPTKYLWYMYCGSVALVLTVIKLVNYGLHHMYDTTDCVEEVIKYDWQGQKREDEGIELQILSKSTENTRPSRPPMIRNLSFAGVSPTTDGDSIESIDFPQNTGNNPTTTKPSSTIDLKAEVHRKNSSESSEESARAVETVAQDLEATERDVKKAEKTLKHQRSQTEGLVRFTFKDETLTPSVRFSKRPDSGDLQEQIHMQFVDRDCLHLPPYIHDIGRRRHSNFTNGSLNLLPVNERSDIRPTGSLELEYIDQNPHQYLATEGFSFKPHPRNDSGVRRIRSTVLASHVFTPLIAHRNSLEIIGCKSAKNPLPPPSTSLTRNHHLNLCTYYGSEIVYPIEELSAEHQTSHDADDLDSISRISDSDLEDTNQGSNSPLIYSNMKDVCSGINQLKVGEEEKASATSKDILLDNDDSNSSANSNSEMQDARTECYHAVDASSDKKLGECSNMACSSASVEFEERTDRKQAAVVKHMPIEKWDENSTVNKNLTKVESDYKLCDVECDGGQPGILRKRNARRHKKKKVSINARKSENVEAARCCSSLVELDLDWLFDDEGGHLPHRKEPLKSDSDWLGTTTVSLEHDVSKVLQEPVPSTRSLGAIPKKTRGSSSHIDHHQTDRKTPKSESEKCSMCRCKTDGQPSDERSSTRSRSSKENKVTQTLKRSDSFSPVEAVDFLKVERPEQHSHMGPSLNRSKRGTTFKKMARHQIEEPSSGGSNNELSTLLPAAPLLSVFLNSRREFPRPSCIREGDCYLLDYAQPHPHHRSRLKRGRCNRRRSNQVVKRESAIASSISAGYGTHSAKNFNDTSDGSIHCFMDEYGNWMTYTFDEKGIGTANETRTANNVPQTSFSYQNDQAGRTAIKDRNVKREFLESNSTESICDSSISTIIDAKLKSRVHSNPNSANTLFPQMHHSSLPDNIPAMRRRSRRITTGQSLDLVNNTDDSMISVVRGENENNDEDTRNKFYKVIQALYNNSNFPRTKTYYMYKVLPWTIIKVTLDRLKLLALLDRNLTISETMLSIFLGILVSVLGAILLYCNFYNDVLAFVFCFIMASCQYSLLKSVQPDAASPTHGFNRVIAYSRPIYFCIVSIIVIILHINLDPSTIDADYIFTETDTSNQQILLYTRDFLIMFILFFPILFSLGLFPQINTFIMYLLEQVDMHVFGGNAMSNLLASFYCIFRSILAVIVMNGLAYGGLSEPKSSQHILFSMFCACLVACSYHLSRSASDPSHIWNIMKKHLWPPEIYREHVKTLDEIKVSGKETTVNSKTNKTNDSDKEKDGSNLGKNVKFPSEVKETKPPDEHVDPLPHKLQKTVNGRLKNDVILCSLIALVVFGIHTSTVFTVLQPELGPVLWSITASMGFILHYVIPQMRKQLPWLCIARPILRSHEFDQYQARAPAKIMWFERIYVYFCFLERNLLYPLLFLAALTEDAPKIALKYGVVGGSFLVVICGLKCLRSSYSEQNSQYLILTFTALFFKFDYSFSDETFLLEYFFMSIAFHKFSELLLKIQFVVTYIAPWQITWGSAFHAFAQPFSVPHSAMLFLQAFISATLSTPLNPFLGSAIFLTSYVRPVKFWERDYNTRRVDHSNTPLSSHLDRNLGADDNNLNSIFYEHLTRSLQHSLCGDLALGRWGPVNQGDCFVLASDYLNCLIHIIEMGNGLVTFQMRGLEFRGTYCQQREVEAITEDVEENYGCCCCDTGHLPNMLSVNAAFSQRWLAWEVTAAKYILEGYSISDNNAVSMLQVFDFRKYLISFYVKSIIFYTIRSPKLLEWLSCQTILKALQPMEHRNFVDLDPVFNYNIDEDYDHQNSGMTRNVFIQVHGDWLNYCVEKSDKDIDAELNASLVLLCFALSLLGRRALGAVSHSSGPNVEFFLYGLHALFKGDFRITCARDEWVFTDMDLLKTVVAPAVRMSLKLHQDHFMTPDEYEDLSVLYNAICDHEEELVISHEGDPAWRNAVLSGTSSLLALRRVMDEGQDEYKIIMLNKRYLTFRVIKVNKECVRGLWAGQQQELVYLRNRNPERGSIQNAKQALRNIINSSCDQPIGYPIYVSPLTTSYAETNEQFKSLLGGSLTLKKIKNYVFNTFRRIRKRCGEGCSSGASNREEIGMGHEGVYAMTPITALGHHTTGSQSMDGSHLGGSMGRGSSLSRTSLGGNRGSLISMGKPTSSTLASLAGLFKEKDERAVSQAPDAQARGDERLGDATDVHERDLISSRVRILDPNLVYDGINLGRRIDVCWPTEYMRMRGGRSHWKDWVPEAGMEGPVVHKWTPCNKDPNKRSHVDRTILLIQIEDKYVPIAESGVQDLGPEV